MSSDINIMYQLLSIVQSRAVSYYVGLSIEQYYQYYVCTPEFGAIMTISNYDGLVIDQYYQHHVPTTEYGAD